MLALAAVLPAGAQEAETAPPASTREGIYTEEQAEHGKYWYGDKNADDSGGF